MKKLIKIFIYNLFYNFLCSLSSFKANMSTYFCKKKYLKYEEVKGDVAITSKQIICVFSHFSCDGKIADYIVPYIKALYESGCGIIFISTSKKIDQASIKIIKPYISSLLTRYNIGRDFGSFHCGYEIAKKYDHHKYLVFANDSVYGPLYPLDPIFNLIKGQNCDVAGFTDSWQKVYHLQSYFLIFTRKVFTSEVFENFFKTFKFSNNKIYIINKYELGLSTLLMRNGFNLQAVYNYFDVAKSFYEESLNIDSTYYQNPTHKFWRTLIQDYKYPFLKRELILLNPSKVNDLYLWKSTVEELNYSAELIENHLKLQNSKK